MKHIPKILSILALVLLLAFTFIRHASAFDGRSGDRVVIGAEEVIDDDLYVTAQEFILDGTVNGDVIAFAQTVTVNGRVDGDLMSAAQTVVVNGEVTGSVRVAGSVLMLGEQTVIGMDILGAGYSLEGRPGSAIGQDVLFAGGQMLLAGEVARNVQAAAGALEVQGTVGGDVQADVGGAGQAVNPPMFGPPSPVPVPSVPAGLTLAPSARIEGDLEYTQADELIVPAGVVGGRVTRTQPTPGGRTPQEATSSARITTWALNFLRNSLTLILIGLFLLWLFPVFMRRLSEHLQSNPLPSLGWGVVAWVVFFLSLFVIVFVMILSAILFGVLTLGQLTGTVLGLGLLTLLGLVIGFVLVTSFLAKVVFGAALGGWIFRRTNSPLAEHRYWPMVVGVLITVGVIALLSFPLIPGFLGGLLNFIVVLLGLGALWLWGRERIMARRGPASLA